MPLEPPALECAGITIQPHFWGFHSLESIFLCRKVPLSLLLGDILHFSELIPPPSRALQTPSTRRPGAPALPPRVPRGLRPSDSSPRSLANAPSKEPQDLIQSPGKLPIRINPEGCLIRQVLEGLAFIHERGIAHGDESRIISSFRGSQPLPDLYPSNIGVAIPDLDAFSENDIWDMDGPPTIAPLVPSDQAHDAASFPPYLTNAIDLRQFLARKVPGFAAREPRVRILDLGCGYFAEESPSPQCHTPLSYAAPEVAFPIMAHGNRDAPWDRRADIWAMGCTIHKIAGLGILFGHLGSHILDDMAALCGGLPADWTAYFTLLTNNSKVPPKAHTPKAADALWAKTTERLQIKGQTAEDAQGLVKLLRRMLVIDPMERPTASALLQDPYFDLTTSERAPLPVEHPSPVGPIMAM
ncbi:kinase-like domain-containing protein [Mycena rebaudengoi]|nr:kinase-like domain-containing protein [Mycena rebaudengoi]